MLFCRPVYSMLCLARLMPLVLHWYNCHICIIFRLNLCIP
nr:MAG TPA: hypothetical protein [Caudoviricetes sp.]